MGTLPAPGHRARVLLSAAALFAGIFAGRLVTGDGGNGLTFLYVLPIVMIAVQLGRSAGIAAGLGALALFVLWADLKAADLEFLAYFSRATAFVLVGAITGHTADRMRSAARQAEAAARHFELSRDMLCTASFEGYLTTLNESWERTLGWSREELTSRPLVEFVHPEDRAETERQAVRTTSGDLTASFTNRYATKDGGWRWIDWTAQADPDERVIYAVARDVTERRGAEQARREAEERFGRAFEDSAIGMALVGLNQDEHNVILAANTSLARIVGLPRDQLVGMGTLVELAAPEDVPAIAKGMQRLEDGDAPVYRGELRIVRPDGRRVWVDLTTSIVRDDAGAPLYRLSQIVDIDARRRAEEQLRHLVDHDLLSGVYNRRRFEQELQRELGYAAMKRSRGAVLLLDVDRFKDVNDSLGHAAGDAVIARIGHTLTDTLRSSDVVGRLGGDEFAVLLRRVEPAEAREVARSLRAVAIENIAEVAGGRIEGVTLSVGVASFGHGEVPSLDEVLHIADAAMYEAKRAGGNRVSVAATA